MGLTAAWVDMNESHSEPDLKQSQIHSIEENFGLGESDLHGQQLHSTSVPCINIQWP
jgi:hypothetical protein